MNRPSRNSFKAPLLVLAVFCLFFSQLALPSSRAAHSDGSTLVSTATPEGRLVVFDDIWETIEGHYYDPRFNGVDWHAQRTSFRPAAAKASSTHEFYELMRQMLASLRD